MRTHREPARFWSAIVLVSALSWLILAATTAAQEEPEAPPAPEARAAEVAETEAPEGGETEEGEAEEPAEPKKIPLNLNKADIDKVIKFLSDKTGKVVVKAKDVKAQITIVSPTPVTPERAVELICYALRLEGVAAIEKDNVISLVPVKQEMEVGVETIAPEATFPDAGVVRRIIKVKFADVAELEKVVKPLLPETAKVVADPRSKTLIITAPVQNVINLEKLVAELDVLEIRESQVRIFQLKHAVAEEIAPIVEAILQNEAGKPGKEGKPSGKPGQKATGQDLTVVAYAPTNWLVVRGSKEKLEAAARLIQQLDKEKPPELQLRVIVLTHANARDLARQLSSLFAKRPRKKTVRETVELTAEERGNALVVLSSEANFELIRKIIAELDTEESRRTETRSYQLQYADPEDVAEQLNDLYSRMYETSYSYGYSYRRRSYSSTTRFVPERRTNTLIIIAEPSEFRQIESLIKQLDQPISKAEVSPHIYHIRNLDAKELTDVLNKIFGIEETRRTSGYYSYWDRQRGTEREVGRLYGKVRFVHEPATNSVIVISNNAENFPIIEALIEQLDKPTAEYANTMVYELENADAIALADQLNSLFAVPGAGKPAEKKTEEEERREAYYGWLVGAAGKEKDERPISNLIGQVRLVPDTRINALLITTAPQNFEILRELIKKLDKESPKVLINIRLVEIMRTRESRIGVRFSSNASVFEGADFNNGFLSNFGLEWQRIYQDGVLSGNVNVALLVQFLQRNFDARILSQPSLVVNNNKEAEIFVGAQVPFISESQSTPGTTARSDTYEYKDAGTKLKIQPLINKLDKIVTSVHIESSQIRSGEVLFGGFVLDTRTYDTEIAVEDGQTMVIGGILRQDESESVHRIPILGHIPVLNLLFRKRVKAVTTTELIAFITPTVLRSRADDDRALNRRAKR